MATYRARGRSLAVCVFGIAMLAVIGADRPGAAIAKTIDKMPAAGRATRPAVRPPVAVASAVANPAPNPAPNVVETQIQRDQQSGAHDGPTEQLTEDLIHGDDDLDVESELPGTGSSAHAPVYRWMEVTAYCPCTQCCGASACGITASGLPVTHNDGRFVAADTQVVPMHARVRVPGYHHGEAVPVLDRGGAIKGNKLDLFFPTHDEALQWGRQWVLVEVLPG